MMLKLKLLMYSSSTLAISCEELTHWKRLWCWEGLGAGGGDDRRWDGWMASLTRWTWVWVNSGSWWWTGRPGVLRCMGSQRVGHDWATELNWILYFNIKIYCICNTYVFKIRIISDKILSFFIYLSSFNSIHFHLTFLAWVFNFLVLW